MVFKKVILYNVKQGNKNTDNSCRMQHKATTAKQQPGTTGHWIALLGAHSHKITERAEQCCHKRCDNKKMTQLPGPQMLSYELGIHANSKVKIQK